MSDQTVDNIYINCSINNPGDGNVLERKPARFNVTYEQPIIDDATDYYMSVIKFEIPLQGLPLFIFPIKPNQGNPNMSPLSVGVCENTDPTVPTTLPLTPGNDSPVTWVQQQQGITAPIQNQSYQVVTPYYYCYSYSHFVWLINRALNTAWGLAGSPGGAGKFPYFEYDTNTKLINLIMPYEFVNAASGTGFGWTVYFNDFASYYFQAFDYNLNYTRFEIATHSLATNNSYIAGPPYPQAITTTAGPPDLIEPVRGPGLTYIIKSEYPANDYINSVRKIVFTTNQLPVVKEYFPSPGQSQSSDVSYLGVLTDFNLDINNVAGSQRSIALYDANIYKMIDLINPTPIRSIDLQIYWADGANNLYPLEIGNLDTVNIKLAFFSKKAYRANGSKK